MKPDTERQAALTALAAVLDRFAGRYRERTGTRDFGAYLGVAQRADDEEVLTEPVLADILEDVLGFPVDRYFPQLGRSGSKPDVTPADLVAHPFVLDAKSSAIADLDAHEEQIRRYIRQRGLRFGVLFNLREMRVYAAGQRGHDARLSFRLLPLWRIARGEAMAGPELEHFDRFLALFRHRALSLAERIDWISRAEPGAGRRSAASLWPSTSSTS